MSGSGLRIDGVHVRLPGQAAPVLSGVSLALRPGEAVGVCGRSGSGKSTLLAAISGLVPWARAAEVRGAVLLDGDDIGELDPGQRAHLLATCLDRPDAQLFLGTPRQEIAAVQHLHGTAPLRDAPVDALRLRALLDARIGTLSSGERQRVALAVALAAAPRPVLLDEPLAHLDADGAAALVSLLGEVKAIGGSILLAEQAGWRLGNVVDRWLELHEGALAPCPRPSPPVLSPPSGRTGEVVLEARDLTVERGEHALLRGVSLCVRAGEVVILNGANGSGKSSLLRVLAGHDSVAGGGLRWSGALRRAPSTALMLSVAELQLFAETVAGELTLSGADATTVSRVLQRHRLAPLAGRAPWTLSRGERQRLVHAALDVLQPPLVLVDELAQGLDPTDLAAIAELIGRRAARGRAYLIATHRDDLAGLAHRRLAIEGGTVIDRGVSP
ncbi:MAG: ATP-binding cassette domain-containing protein [Thermoanaerobaculales bacterium]